MISETLTLVENALKNTTYGVNTFIPQETALLSGVYNEIDTYWVCIGGEPKTFPVLIVTLAGEVDYTMPEVRTSVRDVEIPIAISYWHKLEDTDKGAYAGYTTLAATMKTLRQWLRNENAGDRIQDNIQIVETLSIRQTPRTVSVEQDINILMSLIVTLRVRDTNP